jgi:hypothetical protein
MDFALKFSLREGTENIKTFSAVLHYISQSNTSQAFFIKNRPV